MQSGKSIRALLLKAWWAPAVIMAGSYLVGCAHHHHEGEHVTVLDDRGYRHEGFYDENHRWHGGYDDDQHVHHDDPDDWHH